MAKLENNLFQDEESLIRSLSIENDGSRNDSYQRWKKSQAPTTRDEYWKYTRLAPVLNKTYAVSNTASEFNTEFLRDIDAYNLVFVNGIFSEEHSNVLISDDAIISNLKHIESNHPELLKELGNSHSDEDYFSLLNGAFYQDGSFILIRKNVKLQKAIRIINLNNESERMINAKGIVRIEKGASAKIIETWDEDNSSNSLMNSRVDYHVDENAELEVTKLQSIGIENSLINQDFVNQEGNSRFTAHTVSMQGKLIRNNLNINLNGQGSECNMNGLYMARGSEHIDNHTHINHLVPHCESNELYKGILNEKSKGVFNGKVIVGRDAQKTNAFQYNGNILLTDDCQVYSKPELEIYADDVKCSHGSTTGQLDEEALFYLQSRGIGKDKARNLLLQAFAREVLDRISNEQIRDRVDLYISERYNTDGDS